MYMRQGAKGKSNNEKTNYSITGGSSEKQQVKEREAARIPARGTVTAREGRKESEKRDGTEKKTDKYSQKI